MSLEEKVEKLVSVMEKAFGEKGRSSSFKSETPESEKGLKGMELLEAQDKRYKDLLQTQELLNKKQDDYLGKERLTQETEEERLGLLKQMYESALNTVLEREKEIDILKKLKETQGELSEDEQKKLETLEKELPLLEEKRKERELALKDEIRITEEKEKQKKAWEGIKSVAKELFQIGQQQEKQIIEISKLTGGYATLLSNIRDASREAYAATLGSGITGEQVNAAMLQLGKNLNNLKTFTAESISTMTVATAQLEKVGVNGALAAKGFDTLVNAMGKTPGQAAKIQESFVQMAAKNKMALSAVSEAFAANSDRMVGYGEKTQQVLEGLSYQALQTGASIQSLIDVAKGFDTFEDAARKVGSLNSLLGGDYLNSIEMLTASDEERIKLLRDGISASGMQWESMNRFQKMAIANAAGIKDLNEAAKMFGAQSAENTKQQAEQAEVQKTLAEQAESVSLSMDKLKSTLNGLLIAIDPFISLFRFIVDILVFIPQQLSKVGGVLGQVLAATSSVLIFMALRVKLLGGAFGALKNKIIGAIAQLKIFNSTPPTPPVPAGGGLSGITAGINPSKMIGAAAAIAILAGAMFIMAKAFQEFGNVKNGWQAFGLAAAGMIILVGAALIVDSLKKNIIAGAIALGILGVALNIVANAMKTMGQIDPTNLNNSILALTGILVLVGILGALMFAGGGIGALVFGAGILALLALGLALSVLADSLKNLAIPVETISSSLTKLFDSLDKIAKISDLKTTLTNVTDFIEKVANDATIAPLIKLSKAVKDLADSLEKFTTVSDKLKDLSSKAQFTVSTEELAKKNTEIVQNVSSGTFAASVNTTRAIATSAQTISENSGNNAVQNVAYVPVEVSIGKDKILDIFKGDFQSISKSTSITAVSRAVSSIKSSPTQVDVTAIPATPR